MIQTITIPTPFAVGDVNAFLLKGDALSLIDAGPKTPDAYEALERGIKEAGYTFNDIEQVILTHHHPDHAGWVEAFENAAILGHPYNDFWLRRDEAFSVFHDAFYEKRFVEAGVPDIFFKHVKKMKNATKFIGNRPLDKMIQEGDDLPGHPGWQVLETLGHAQSHLAFWHKSTGTLIGGDLLLAKVSSNPLIEPPLDMKSGRPKSMLQYNASLKRLLDLPVELVYTGHGDEIRNAHELIRTRLQKQHDRAMNVFTMIGDDKKTAIELTQQLFPTVYKKQLGLTLSETIGQVDYLVNEELIEERKHEKGFLYYEKR